MMGFSKSHWNFLALAAFVTSAQAVGAVLAAELLITGIPALYNLLPGHEPSLFDLSGQDIARIAAATGQQVNQAFLDECLADGQAVVTLMQHYQRHTSQWTGWESTCSTKLDEGYALDYDINIIKYLDPGDQATPGISDAIALIESTDTGFSTVETYQLFAALSILIQMENIALYRTRPLKHLHVAEIMDLQCALRNDVIHYKQFLTATYPARVLNSGQVQNAFRTRRSEEGICSWPFNKSRSYYIDEFVGGRWTIRYQTTKCDPCQSSFSQCHAREADRDNKLAAFKSEKAARIQRDTFGGGYDAFLSELQKIIDTPILNLKEG